MIEGEKIALAVDERVGMSDDVGGGVFGDQGGVSPVAAFEAGGPGAQQFSEGEAIEDVELQVIGERGSGGLEQGLDLLEGEARGVKLAIEAEAFAGELKGVCEVGAKLFVGEAAGRLGEKLVAGDETTPAIELFADQERPGEMAQLQIVVSRMHQHGSEYTAAGFGVGL